jgi:hypothetical protein
LRREYVKCGLKLHVEYTVLIVLIVCALFLFAVVYDVYVTTALVVKLLDINPIGGATSPLLFTWEELGYHAEDLEVQGAHAPPHEAASTDAAPYPPNTGVAGALELSGTSSTSLNIYQSAEALTLDL